MRVESIPVIDRQEFQRLAASNSRLLHDNPWIVTGHAETWPEYQRWRDIDYLKDRFGDLMAYASAPHFVTNRNQRKFSVKTSFAQYLEYVSDPGRIAEIYGGEWAEGTCDEFMKQDLPLYCGSLRMVHHANDNILKELHPLVPDPIETWNHAIPYYYVLFNHFWLFVSPPGALTPLHRDNNGIMAFLAQLRGKKRVILYSPDDARHVYNEKVGYLDPVAPNAQDFPTWDSAVQWKGEIETGQVLFFGTNWSHHVETVETSVSVSFDFVNDTNMAAYAASPQWAEGFGKRIKLNPSMYIDKSAGTFSVDEVESMSSVDLGRKFMTYLLRQTLEKDDRSEVARIRSQYLSRLVELG